jgi:hypothetical protein
MHVLILIYYYVQALTSYLKYRFMECKDRKNRSSVMLSYNFLPSMPAEKLRNAANKVSFLTYHVN